MSATSTPSTKPDAKSDAKSDQKSDAKAPAKAADDKSTKAEAHKADKPADDTPVDVAADENRTAVERLEAIQDGVAPPKTDKDGNTAEELAAEKHDFVADKIEEASQRVLDREDIKTPTVNQPPPAGFAVPGAPGVVDGPWGPEIPPWLDCLQRAEKAYNDGDTAAGDELIALMFRYRGIRVQERA